MRKIIVLLAALALVFGCVQPTDPVPQPTPTPEPAQPPEPNVFVVNSAWEIVHEATLSRSRDLTSDAGLQAMVDEYNATHTDDQYFLLEDEVPPIEEAPDATIAVAYADTWERFYEDTLPRAELAAERDRIRKILPLQSDIDGRPLALYVDNAPPDVVGLPPPPDERDPYEKWALYIVSVNTGAIYYEEHLETLEMYLLTLSLYNTHAELYNRDHPDDQVYMVAGQLYSPPEEP